MLVCPEEAQGQKETNRSLCFLASFFLQPIDQTTKDQTSLYSLTHTKRTLSNLSPFYGFSECLWSPQANLQNFHWAPRTEPSCIHSAKCTKRVFLQTEQCTGKSISRVTKQTTSKFSCVSVLRLVLDLQTKFHKFDKVFRKGFYFALSWQQTLLNFRPSASQMAKRPLTNRYKIEYSCCCCCSQTFRRSTPSSVGWKELVKTFVLWPLVVSDC